MTEMEMDPERGTPLALAEAVATIDPKYHDDDCSSLFYEGSDECNCGLVVAIQDALGGFTILGRHAHGPGIDLNCPSTLSELRRAVEGDFGWTKRSGDSISKAAVLALIDTALGDEGEERT